MDIVFSIKNNAEVYVLPVCPEIEIEETQNNETFDGLSFDIRMIGKVGLRTLSISSFFPRIRYPYVNPYAEINPSLYIDFFRRIKEEMIPARIVITDKHSKEILNMAVSIDNFNYKYRNNGEVDYTLDLTEYIFFK